MIFVFTKKSDLFELNRFFKFIFPKFKNVLRLKQWKPYIKYPINYMVVNQMLPLISFAYITTTKKKYITSW